MTNKRTETRLRSRGDFRILTDGAQPIVAKLIDTSPSGIGLEADIEFASGTLVRLQSGGIEIAEGIVRHCQASGGRFLIGVVLIAE